MKYLTRLLAGLALMSLLAIPGTPLRADSECCQIVYGKCSPSSQNTSCTHCTTYSCTGTAKIYTIFANCACEFASGTTTCTRGSTSYSCAYNYNCIEKPAGCAGSLKYCDPDYDHPTPASGTYRYNWSATGGACP